MRSDLWLMLRPETPIDVKVIIDSDSPRGWITFGDPQDETTIFATVEQLSDLSKKILDALMASHFASIDVRG